MDLNSDSESEDGVAVEVAATLEGKDEDEGKDEVESDEGMELAEEARRQAEAEGLTLLPSSNKAGYRHVYYVGGSRAFGASVRRARKKVHLGSFSTAEEAALAVARATARTEVASLKPAPRPTAKLLTSTPGEPTAPASFYSTGTRRRGVDDHWWFVDVGWVAMQGQ